MEATKDTVSDLLAKLNQDFSAGRTVYAVTRLRETQFTKKAVAMLRANGAEPFKIGQDGTLRMFEGWTKKKARYVTVSLTNGALLIQIYAERS